jgi:hypothetical protein
MAEIRKHKETGGDIAKAVREAMGETIRPVTPGSQPADKATERSDDYDPFAGPEQTPAAGQAFTFSVVNNPVIGVVPEEFLAPAEDDD